ncbi:hypothetical protein EAF00_002668 [Botryotinia globosa]|nr:hypothetical protein EAF00_002668 [Botryotinia globosa]
MWTPARNDPRSLTCQVSSGKPIEIRRYRTTLHYKIFAHFSLPSSHIRLLAIVFSQSSSHSLLLTVAFSPSSFHGLLLTVVFSQSVSLQTLLLIVFLRISHIVLAKLEYCALSTYSVQLNIHIAPEQEKVESALPALLVAPDFVVPVQTAHLRAPKYYSLKIPSFLLHFERGLTTGSL